MTETPTRARTRAAILKAAFTVLAANQAASLGEIADAAGVARSTLHRYYPEREDLLAALRACAGDEMHTATLRARLEEGLAIDALVRLCHEYFDRWDILTWSYLDSIAETGPSRSVEDDIDPDLTTLIARGQADGTIDPKLPNAWLQQMLWGALYIATAYYSRQGGTKHEALTLMLDAIHRLTAPAR